MTPGFADPRTPWSPSRAAAALLGFAAAWALAYLLMRNGFYSYVSEDMRLYRNWAQLILDGAVPYRDFPMAYPPLCLPAFILPALFGDAVRSNETYQLTFAIEMLASGLVAVWCVIDAGRSLRLSDVRLRAIAWLLLVTPLVMGPLIMSRYDLWPATLAVAAVAALLRGRDRVAMVLLALGVGAKVYPVLLAPAFLLFILRQSGRREALAAAGAGIAAGAIQLVPFLLLAPAGMIDAIRTLFARPPQVEMLGATILFVRHGLVGTPLRIVASFGSRNLMGAPAATLALAQFLLMAAGLVALWTWQARRPADADSRQAAVTVAAASLALYVALGKVLSDQYVIWLIPIVLLVPGPRGVIATAMLMAAVAMTAAFYPEIYLRYVTGTDIGASLFALARALLLLGVALVLSIPWHVPRSWWSRPAAAPA